MGDEQFALALDSLRGIKDFRSLTYRANAIGEMSVSVLIQEYVSRRVPFNLAELKIIDCKATPAAIVKLVQAVSLPFSGIQSLSLVNCGLGEKSILSLADSATQSCSYLKKLELSWSKVSRSTWTHFFDKIKSSS
jgi:hypothetical protein